MLAIQMSFGSYWMNKWTVILFQKWDTICHSCRSILYMWCWCIWWWSYEKRNWDGKSSRRKKIAECIIFLCWSLELLYHIVYTIHFNTTIYYYWLLSSIWIIFTNIYIAIEQPQWIGKYFSTFENENPEIYLCMSVECRLSNKWKAIFEFIAQYLNICIFGLSRRDVEFISQNNVSLTLFQILLQIQCGCTTGNHTYTISHILLYKF